MSKDKIKSIVKSINKLNAGPYHTNWTTERTHRNQHITQIDVVQTPVHAIDFVSGEVDGPTAFRSAQLDPFG